MDWGNAVMDYFKLGSIYLMNKEGYRQSWHSLILIPYNTTNWLYRLAYTILNWWQWCSHSSGVICWCSLSVRHETELCCLKAFCQKPGTTPSLWVAAVHQTSSFHNSLCWSNWHPVDTKRNYLQLQYWSNNRFIWKQVSEPNERALQSNLVSNFPAIQMFACSCDQTCDIYISLVINN